MQTQLGIVMGYEVTTNRDSERDVIMLQVALSEDDDAQSVQLFCGHGETHIPPIDSVVVVVSITPSYKIAIACDDGLDPSTINEGERLLYSQDSDGIHRTEIWLQNDGAVEIKTVDSDEVEQAKIKLDSSGNITLNDGTDWAVQFTELKSAFDQLKSDFDALVSTYNTHTHVVPNPGTAGTPPTVPSAATTATGNPSSADMSDAKVETVRIP